MRKKFGDNRRPIEVDPITGDYHIVIPEWVVNDLGWYEETELEFNVEGGEVILKEPIDD